MGSPSSCSATRARTGSWWTWITGRSEADRDPRRVEPYSLRRSQEGNLLLFVVNDYGQLRSYRLDHVAGIKPTAIPFTPRFRVEF